jgi:hypothetical protein
MKVRMSLSQTIARPVYNNMFMTTATGAPSTLTMLGGVPKASRGNPGLAPLESTNFDLSFEWYYGESSYMSVGFFKKAVNNFVGNPMIDQSGHLQAGSPCIDKGTPTDAPGKDFTEFAAFDLSMDEQVASALGGVRDGIRATDLPVTELQCLRSLVRLEPNVTEVAAFLQKSLTILGELEDAARWRDLAAQAASYRQLAGELRERRPDVADAIDHAMAAFFTAVVRAPVTGIILVTEMTGCFTLLLPMLSTCFAAMAVPTLLGNAPIYDSLRERTLKIIG